MCVSIIKIYSYSAEKRWNYADPLANRKDLPSVAHTPRGRRGGIAAAGAR